MVYVLPSPPLAVALILPVPPKHKASVTVGTTTIGSIVGSAIVVSLTHPLASTTFMSLVPAVKVYTPSPVYGEVPPEAVTVNVLLPSEQVMGGPKL
jgi:hypothetical protein